MTSWLILTDANFNLLIIFAAAIGASWLGLVGVSNTSAPRSHSTTKFWNEMMARFQITCAAFFITVLRATTFTQDGTRLRDTISIAIFFVLGFWLLSQKLVSRQDKKIEESHTCTLNAEGVCTINLTPEKVIQILYGNVLLSLITLAFTVIVIFNPYLVQPNPPVIVPPDLTPKTSSSS